MGNPVDRVGLSGQTVTLLLVGVDADALSDSSNGAAPPGAANADAVLLARFQNSGALRVLQIPTELAVQLPGSMGSWRYQGSGRGVVSSFFAMQLPKSWGLMTGTHSVRCDVTICPSLCC